MIKVRFIHDGRHKGWRYKQGEEILLPDNLANLAITEGMAVPVERPKQNALDRKAYNSERRSLT